MTIDGTKETQENGAGKIETFYKKKNVFTANTIRLESNL